VLFELQYPWNIFFPGTLTFNLYGCMCYGSHDGSWVALQVSHTLVTVKDQNTSCLLIFIIMCRRQSVRASSGTLPVWVSIWPCEKAPRNWGKSLRPDLACVIWYLALWESQTSRETVFKGPQMASCPSDVNKSYADHVLLLLLCSHFKGDITKS
jgi:hypothetical protein